MKLEQTVKAFVMKKIMNRFLEAVSCFKISENGAKLKLLAIMEVANKSSDNKSDAFWADTLKQLLRSTIDLISLATLFWFVR